jgi:DNA repair exonuclease SbcCD ATPase subunit
MLPRKLEEIRNRIAKKDSFRRTDQEKELLGELSAVDEILERRDVSTEFRESVRKHTQITSGPGGSCPCCGR